MGKDKTNGCVILLVDDDPRNIFALASYLELSGMVVRTAENGYAALEMLQRHKDIELVLMDMMMPEMDGYEAIGRIRQSPDMAAIPVIAVTARAMKGDREKCLEAGANAYVSKPVDLQDLMATMQHLLS